MADILYISLAALLVHSVFFISIFDIYFTSPVDHGMVPQYYSLQPPAKRLVLFVADGLRADTIYSLDEQEQTHAPYLRNIVEYTGRWGVSHTHVPTESRPGHVALVAGFYEDISAVTRGWQENPVEFDSLFNRSRHTWSWGSPDILPMFSKGAVPGRVETFTYNAYLEDFADSDPSRLDTWVFERVKELFKRAKEDTSLAEMLAQDKIVLFLHLLGLDTNGHSHKPNSVEVIENLKLVDKGVGEIVKLIDSYYSDDKTAYVFTSDHGMTDWGSHGAGLPEETMTPLICWGAGVKGPRSSSDSKYVYHDGFSEKWKLDRYERVDVEQADITALMATLIGVALPLNSEGVIPLAYLHYNKGFLAESIFANARQLLEQVRVKAARCYQTSLPLTFRPFPKLGPSELVDKRKEIDELIKERNLERAIDLSHKLIDLCKEGMTYYHTYHRFLLKLVLTLGFVGWVLCVVVTILEENTKLTNSATFRRQQQSHISIPKSSTVLIFIISLLLLYQSSPILYYLYYVLPVVFWTHLWKHRAIISTTWQLAVQNPAKIFKGTLYFFFVLLGLEMLTVSFFFREMLSILLLLVSFWPYLTELIQTHFSYCIAWSVLCYTLAVFPLLPVIGRSANFTYVTLAGLVMIGISAFLLRWPQFRILLTAPHSNAPLHLVYIQVVLLGVSTFIPALTNSFFAQKETIPHFIHAFSWITLILSTLLPLLGPRSLPGRLLHILLSFFTIFILLSTSFEAIFTLLLCTLLYVWLAMEAVLVPKHARSFSAWEADITYRFPKVVTLMPNEVPREKSGTSFDDVRRAWLCIFLGILSFFGIGNIASINTFDPTTVYSFITVFSPFVMGALLIWKMMIPFVFVGSVFNCILSLLSRSLRTNLLLMLVMSDVMGLNFFFLVRDSGSWLEIGISISHYIIMMTMVIAVVVLMGVARLLTGVAFTPRKAEDHVY